MIPINLGKMNPFLSHQQGHFSDETKKRNRLGQIMVALFALALFALLACAGRPQVAQRVEADQEPENISVSLKGNTSVLITDQPNDPSNEIGEIRISPTSIVVDPSDSIDLSVVAFDARGQRMADLDFVWSMVDPRAGNITREGRFTSGLVPGVYEEAVSVTGVQNTPTGIKYISQTAFVTVVGELAVSRLTSVAILPDQPTVLSGQIYRMRAVGFDQSGLVIPGVSFAWRVNDPILGRVNDLGFLTVEGKEGNYFDAVTVTGIWEGSALAVYTDVNVIEAPEDDDFLSVQILPRSFQLDQGDRLQLRAIALNGLGQLVNTAQFRWILEDPRAGTIGNSGVFIAGAEPGIFTESIKVEAVVFEQNGIARAEDFASVVVRQEKRARRLESMRVMPQSIVAERRAPALLTAHGVDELGKAVDNITFSWEAVHENVGTIDDKGQFIASDVPGNYPESLRVTIRQIVGDEIVSKSRSVDVIITGTLSQIEIKPTLATIAPGRTVHFTARGYDENGNMLNGVITRWAVSDDGMGEIDAFGNFTAGNFPGLYEGAIQAEVMQRQPRR